mmetsp:Transcript_8263/g.51475  ORF Transcript_8263/g.51475 Transcript_8263/m.51475 type:complete len:375 (+) Transcript_8263:64-1188(+)
MAMGRVDVVARSHGGHRGRTFDVDVRGRHPLRAGEDDGDGGWTAVTAGEDRRVRRWRWDAHQPAQVVACGTPAEHPCAVLRVRWTPDPSRGARGFASAGEDGVVRVWRVSEDDGGAEGGDAPTCASRLEPHGAEVYACEYLAEDPARIVTCAEDEVALWDVERGRKVHVHRCGTGPGRADVPSRWRNADAFGCSASGDGRRVACTCSDGSVHVLDVRQDGFRNASIAHVHEAMACGCAFDDDGRRLASVDVRGQARVYDVRASRMRCAWDVGAPLFSCTYGERGGAEALYCTARDGRMHVCVDEPVPSVADVVPVLPNGSALLCCASWKDWILAAGEAMRDPSYGPFVCAPVQERASSLHAWTTRASHVDDVRG